MTEVLENASVDGYCHGIGCCDIRPVQRGLRAFGFKLGLHNGSITKSDEDISNVTAFSSQENYFNASDLYSSWVDPQEPVEFEITITDQPSCESAQMNMESYACSLDSDCINLPTGQGYSCSCPGGYMLEGNNPYIQDGYNHDPSHIQTHDSIILSYFSKVVQL